MRKFIILIFFFVQTDHLFSQKFTFSFYYTQSNIAYLRCPNPLSCTVENTGCKSLILSTDAGSLKKVSECSYIFYPSKTGEAKIIIRISEKGVIRKIGEWLVTVKEFPEVVAYVGGRNGGFISKDALNAQGGISASIVPSMGFDLKYTVKSFKLIAYRNEELLFFQSSDSNMFNEGMHRSFGTLKEKDRVVFSSILVLMPDKKEVYAKPLEFFIE
jgi:hypothetical protein